VCGETPLACTPSVPSGGKGGGAREGGATYPFNFPELLVLVLRDMIFSLYFS